jgi:two-component system sensor histidine kinase SenX3
VYANPAAHALLDHIEMAKNGLRSHRLRDALVDGDAAALRDSATLQIELPTRVIESTAHAARPPGTVVVVVRDITELRGLDRMRRDFIANASHELKTPAASILALAETLRAAQRDPAAVGRLLRRLEHEALRLMSLVRDLLALSRIEEGQPPSLPLDFRRVVEAEAGRMRADAQGAGLRLDVDLGREDIVLTGSDSDLTLMVHNLVDNAIRYTPGGGAISVTLRRCANRAELSVTDTGVGIPAEDLTRVFERFFRVDAARARQTGGTGLGLSIVRNVAQAHGGDVDVVSEVGRGSTFTVRLPLPATLAGHRATSRRESGSPDPAP